MPKHLVFLRFCGNSRVFARVVSCTYLMLSINTILLIHLLQGDTKLEKAKKVCTKQKIEIGEPILKPCVSVFWGRNLAF